MAMKRTIDFHLNDQRKKANLYRAIKNDSEPATCLCSARSRHFGTSPLKTEPVDESTVAPSNLSPSLLGDNDSSSDEDLINSGADLYPLSHYANDPEQLIKQLFSIVRGKRLARLIPPELKDKPFEELKADCLIQLLCMSKKRVLATLEGKEMNSSSDSDDSVDNQRKQMLKAERREEIGQKRAHKENKTKSSKKKKVETESESEHEKPEEKEGKTLLEILELEMKAKAIRALLAPNEQDNDTQLEEAIKNEIVTEKTNDNHAEDKSWSERYEEREDVKEVVKTSKLCANMRRRMLLYQQKMLADRAKLKAEEAKNLKSGVTVKSKEEETLNSKTVQRPLSTEELKEKSSDTVEKSSAASCNENTGQNAGCNISNMKKVHEDGIIIKNNNSVIGSNECETKSNTQESTDDDSQKSTDFERVLSEYSQINADLETTINDFSQKNCDLEEEINECSKRNDDMENTMNICAQKNSDIESAINDFSVKNDNVDKKINENDEEKRDSDNVADNKSKSVTDLDSLISENLKKNVDLKAIVNEYSKRNSSFVALMSEYSQNNVDIQSVIGDYAKGNHKLETIIDEYSNRNSQIKTMIDEYSANNCNVEKIIDRNSRKQSLIDKCRIESDAGKSIKTEESVTKHTDIDCVPNNLGSKKDSTLADKSIKEEDKVNYEKL